MEGVEKLINGSIDICDIMSQLVIYGLNFFQLNESGINILVESMDCLGRHFILRVFPGQFALMLVQFID